MLKSIFLSLNLLGIFLLSFFSIGKVEITHKSNPEIAAGDQTEVTITINKENFSGPGRLKLNFDLADGLIANELENDGSSFTFSNNEALFIWYSIPSEETITIKYILSASETAILGNRKISGTFSYLDENQRKQIAIPDLYIKVVSTESLASTTTNKISSKRTIEAVNNHFIVRIHTIKQQQNGFARIKDNLPEGFSAQPIETTGAVFKNIDNSAKFLWSEIPSSLESFTVSYKLIPPDNHSDDFEIYGTLSAEFLISENENTSIDIPATKYSYNLKNEIAEQKNIKSDSLNYFIKDTSNNEIKTDSTERSSNNSAIETAKTDSTNTETNNQELASNSSLKQDLKEGSQQEEDDDSISKDVKDSKEEIIDSNEENSTPKENNKLSTVLYKVQILAAHRVAGKSYFNKRHSYNGDFSIENHQGWVKYTTGEFDQYKKARNKRESLGSYKFPGPFVTAYNNGDRITVQEALMITKQDWVQ